VYNQQKNIVCKRHKNSFECPDRISLLVAPISSRDHRCWNILPGLSVTLGLALTSVTASVSLLFGKWQKGSDGGGGGAVMEGGDGPPCIVNLRLCSYLKLSQGVAMYFMAGPNWLLLMLLLML